MNPKTLDVQLLLVFAIIAFLTHSKSIRSQPLMRDRMICAMARHQRHGQPRMARFARASRTLANHRSQCLGQRTRDLGHQSDNVSSGYRGRQNIPMWPSALQGKRVLATGSFPATPFSSGQHSFSFRQFFARAAKICGHVCVLWQTISYRKNFFAIVNMQSWLELQVGKHGRINVDEPHFRVIGHQVTPAFRAELSVTPSRFMELSDMFGTLCYLNGARTPEGKTIDRGCRPRSAGLTVAVTHSFGCSHHRELDRTAEALARVCIRRHGYFLFVGCPNS